jgi:hypothetical protein
MKTLKTGIGVHSLVRNILGVEGRVEVPRWGLRQVTNESIIHIDLHKPNNKLVNAWLEHFWWMDEARVYMDSQDSPWLGLGGNHHLPPYSILYAWPWGLHPNVILYQNSQLGNLEIFEIKNFVTLVAHNILCRPLIKVRYEAKL